VPKFYVTDKGNFLIAHTLINIFFPTNVCMTLCTRSIMENADIENMSHETETSLRAFV